VPSDPSTGVPQDSETGRNAEPSPVGAGGHPCRRSRRGVPALLEWIEEAKAVNRGLETRILIAALIAVFIVLVLTRLGWVR
jgi:hypothetical protein